MDPFNEVHSDCWEQVHNLEALLSKTTAVNENSEADFTYSFQDLKETISDLSQAVSISEQNPSQFNLGPEDIRQRKKYLTELEQKLALLEGEWKKKLANVPRSREITTMSNRISQDLDEDDRLTDDGGLDSQFDKFQQQEYIQQQDFQLDSIHKTMQLLNQQAVIMGSELEDQGYMLEDLDQEMDSTSNKLQRGLKRVSYVIEKNKERASDWCIGILVVVLIVLLVLLIVA